MKRGDKCGPLGFQAAAEEPLCAACWGVVDDVIIGVWVLIFYLLMLQVVWRVWLLVCLSAFVMHRRALFWATCNLVTELTL